MKRRSTKQVKIGEIYIGSEYPVLVQSMLNTDTMNTEACVEQAIRIIEAGGKLVRITAPGVKEARNLENIHAELRRRGYTTPLSADITLIRRRRSRLPNTWRKCVSIRGISWINGLLLRR